MHPDILVRPRLPRTIALGSALVLVVAACSSTASPTTAPTPLPTTVPSPPLATTSPATGTTGQLEADVPACAPAGAAETDAVASWVGPVGGTPDIVPILVSAQTVVGPNRFLWSIADTSNRPIAAPDLASRVRFYALERDADTPYATGEGTFIDTGTGHGLYRTSVDFDCAGEWGVEVEAQSEGGPAAIQRMRFTVHPHGTTPGIGEPAPLSDSLTAATPDEVKAVSTDPDPYPLAYEHTIADVVSSGEPSMVFFATPAFCATGVCGPTMEVVKSVAADYADSVGFVNVEPYRLTMTPNGLQPELDGQGNLQPVQAVLDYGIPTEPYLFVVDANGDVAATFEGAVGADELRETLDAVLAANPTA